jgi:hypothetical protein
MKMAEALRPPAPNVSVGEGLKPLLYNEIILKETSTAPQAFLAPLCPVKNVGHSEPLQEGAVHQKVRSSAGSIAPNNIRKGGAKFNTARTMKNAKMITRY